MKEEIENLKGRLSRQPMDYKTFNDTLGIIDKLAQENKKLKENNEYAKKAITEYVVTNAGLVKMLESIRSKITLY